jgi:transcriptional regulator with GAF, ATPase, and Fis domain
MTNLFDHARAETRHPSEHRTRIVGESRAIREVMQLIATVARTNSTVLVLGETGTGKELVASAIHEQSARCAAPFIVLNCAAVPATLLESELFGHERGAFTGAVARRTGRFELAHGGTLFLDEIGELPLELQPRLLRLLQEREYERLGSSQTLHADVRLVAATHRDLGDLCGRREFREDLYYRLNVFPITLPPLRQRRDDIPLLVRHFVEQFAARMSKPMPHISSTTLSTLSNYDWPGNVRELQNVLERALIVSTSRDLEVQLETPRRAATSSTSPAPSSLADMNRAHILSVLRSTNGQVGGPDGAAARLGMKRSTLVFRMKKLGIPHGAQCQRYQAMPLQTLGSQALLSTSPPANESPRAP